MKALSETTAKLFAPLSFAKTDRLHISLSREGNKFIASLSASDERRGRGWLSTNASREWLLRVPERKELDGLNEWELAATDVTACIIDNVWPKSQVSFDADAKLFFDYLLLTCDQQMANADTHAAYKLEKRVPQHSFELHPELPLSDYQQVALHCASQSEGYGLFMEQGCGKTPVMIANVCNAAKALRATGEKRMYRAVVVAPNNVRMNWKNEFDKFSTCKGKVTVLRGGQMQRTKDFIEAVATCDDELYTVVVMSYDCMVRMIEMITSVEWDIAVLDEAHCIKWPETKRCHAAMKLRDAAKVRIPLTGTPICNSILDLYALFEFMGKGMSGFNSWKNFRSFYGVFKDLARGRQKLIGMQNLPFMQERLARCSFIITKEEALPDLPKKVYSIREVEMTAEQKAAYEQIAIYLSHEIESDLNDSDDNGRSLTITNVLTKMLRLAQVTSGFITWDPIVADDGAVLQPRRVERFKEQPKMDEIINALKERDATEKTLIWACWVSDIEALAARCEKEGIKCVTYYGSTSEKNRIEAERAFNEDPDCTVFIGNPAAGGTGLNLLGYPPGRGDEFATDVTQEYYFSQDWSPLKRGQSEDRAHRRGTRRPVTIFDFCVPSTIDEEIRARVLRKRVTAYTIADIREILSNILRGFVSDDNDNDDDND